MSENHMTLKEYHDYLQSDEAPNVLRLQRERDELVHPLMRAFQLCGWLVHHEEDSRRDTKSDNGFPDIVAVKFPHRLVAECKLDGFDPSEDQARWLTQESKFAEWHPLHWVCVPPACAGIDPGFTVTSSSALCFPRVRGDRPFIGVVVVVVVVFPPRARGSTLFRLLRLSLPLVFPACAGIDLVWD